MDQFWETAGLFANLGGSHHFGFIMYDYRGFGRSTGRSTGEESMAADYNAVVSYLLSQGLTSDRLVVVGSSLGSLAAGPAAAGGSDIAINKLVMEKPQSTANVIMQNATGLSLPASMITSYKFDLAQEGFAWMTDNKLEKKMIKVMKKGSRIMITGYNQKGSQTIDHYSLLGFTKAYNATKANCS